MCTEKKIRKVSHSKESESDFQENYMENSEISEIERRLLVFSGLCGHLRECTGCRSHIHSLTHSHKGRVDGSVVKCTAALAEGLASHF